MSYLTGTGNGAMEGVVGITTGSGSTAAAAALNKRETHLLTRCSRDELGGADADADADAAADGSSNGSNSRPGGESQRISKDWSALPEPALYLIMEKVVVDLFSFDGVCKSWRSVFDECKRELFLSMPPLLLNTSRAHPLSGLYSFMERRCFIRKEPFTWPAGRAVIYSVSHGYCLVKYYVRDEVFLILIDPFAATESPAVRIDLPRAPDPLVCRPCSVMTAPPTSPDCLIISLACSDISYCRPGDGEWMTYKFGGDHGDGGLQNLTSGTMSFDPQLVAVLEGKVYALVENGELVIIDSLFPELCFRVSKVKGLPLERGLVSEMAHLVESGGEILFILPVEGGPGVPRWITQGFVVYRLDLPARKWVRVSSLGGRTLFLKVLGTSLTCDDAAKWGGARDCIYWVCRHSDRLLVFHLKDGRAEHLPMPHGHHFFEWLIPSFCYR